MQESLTGAVGQRLLLRLPVPAFRDLPIPHVALVRHGVRQGSAAVGNFEGGVSELGEGGRLDGKALGVGEVQVQDVELAVAHRLEEADEEGHRKKVARRV